MKIISEPRVEVVAFTTFVGHRDYRIPDDGDGAVRTCAFAAKGCYDSFGEKGRANVVNQETIIASGHGSVLEHFSISVFIEGITRALSLELNRHRHFAVSQRSTRYTAEEDAAIVLDPYYAELWARYGEPTVMHYEEQDAEWYEGTTTEPEEALIVGHLNSCLSSIGRYQDEVEALVELNPQRLDGTDLRKWARGKARNLLPHALETRGTWTGNLRAWRHFIELRSERHAEAEIRRLAAVVFAAIQPIAPLYFADYTHEIINGFPEFQTPHRKV